MPLSWDNYPTNYRPATEEDVFAAFQAWARDDTFIDIRDHPFGPNMSLYHWAEAIDAELDIREYYEELRNWFNNTYQIEIEQELWCQLIEEAKSISLLELCEYIVAHNGKMLNPIPLRIAGRECEEAGVFLTLRAAINSSSNMSDNITPSTTIDEVAKNDPEHFVTLLHLTYPDLASQVKTECSWILRILGHALKHILPKAVVCSVLSLTGLAYATVSWHAWLTPSLIVMGAIVGLSWLPPRRIHIQGLETMGDLSREIAWHLRNKSGIESVSASTSYHNV